MDQTSSIISWTSPPCVPGEYVPNTILVTLDEVTKKDQTAQGQ
jgi:hypothetical protein